MPVEDFRDATVLLVAHGSTVNAESAIAPMQHAATLERMARFAEVHVCFWKQAPYIGESLNAIHTPRVFAVPLFLSDGYFTSEVIPRELGLTAPVTAHSQRTARSKERSLFYTEPIGTSARMTHVILTRAAEVFADCKSSRPIDKTALLLAAHGTNKNTDSRRAAEWHVARIRDLNQFAEVHAAFMEEEPRISDVHQFVDAPNVVVVPYFISDGLHAREDVPVLLGESPEDVQRRLRAHEATFLNPTERNGKRIWYGQSVGTAPLVAEVILDRIREAASWDVAL